MRRLLDALGYRLVRQGLGHPSDPAGLGKAVAFIERYREIISDPLNLLIERVPQAGYVDSDGCVILHNGNRVPLSGRFAYYEDFSDILVTNRGVHEPLEEFCFQRVLAKISTPSPTMVELGAYWAHYSMWMSSRFRNARCIMVEPDPHNLEVGRRNFERHGYTGRFVRSRVGAGHLEIDSFLRREGVHRVDILHSDIQGAEAGMLEGGHDFFMRQGADFVFVSTHSQEIHEEVVARLRGFGYRIEVSSDFDRHTTSTDGFVLASSQAMAPVLPEFVPMGRVDVALANPMQLASYVERVASMSR